MLPSLRFSRRTIVLLLPMILLAAPGIAQHVLMPDDMVRVRLLSARSGQVQLVQGVVKGVTAEHLKLVRPGRESADLLSRSHIVGVERGVVEGTYQGLGAGLGFLGLGLATSFVSYATYEEPEDCGYYVGCEAGAGASLVLGFLIGGFVGLITGAVIGARNKKIDWQPAHIPGPATTERVRVRVTAGSGIGLRMTF